MDQRHGRLVWSRRALLRRTALAAGFLAVGRLRLEPTAALAADGADTLQVLSPRQGPIMAAIAERMVFSGVPDLPPFRTTPGLFTIDRALLQVEADVRQQIGWLLWGFEWGPPVFAYQLTTFTRMPPAAQDEYLRGWAASPRELRRLAFRALKNLSMLGYYAQPATWEAIHYDGPWLGRQAGPGFERPR